MDSSTPLSRLRGIPTASMPMRSPPIHPGWLRVVHWVNVVAVLVMVTSGWRIYNASPFFTFSFPPGWTLGGWLGGALQWHFAGMWLFVGNGAAYLALNVATRRFAAKFMPLTWASLKNDIVAALRGKLSHADPTHYNAVQRTAYLFIVLDLIVLVASGLVLWKSVQFSLLREVLGGYESARRVHFVAMALLVSFVAGHIAMVALVPRTLITMIRGR